MESTQVGSDSAFQWTALYCIVVLSLCGDTHLVGVRPTQRYDRLQTWVWTILRLMLAASMFYFGMAKLIPTQMPFVLNRLVEPYGNFSPAGGRSGLRSVSPSRIKSCSARRKCLVACCSCCLGRPRREHWCARSTCRARWSSR